MKLNVEIECPYCSKIHVHRIDVQSEVKPKIEVDPVPKKKRKKKRKVSK